VTAALLAGSAQDKDSRRSLASLFCRRSAIHWLMRALRSAADRTAISSFGAKRLGARLVLGALADGASRVGIFPPDVFAQTVAFVGIGLGEQR
jgi:hypothetical protein